MLIIRHSEVRQILDGHELELVELISDAYARHDEGLTALPHSTFLRFPGNDRDRIIGLPAHIGGERPAAGIKWIASFPANIREGKARASAAIITNSMTDGRPTALIEGSLISARRTAASAALAARTLLPAGPVEGVSLLGGGVINTEILRFLVAVLPGLHTVTVYDPDAERVARFARQCALIAPESKIVIAPGSAEALAAHDLVSLATNAGVPHLEGSALRPGALVLHISLRDLSAETVLAAQNVVDDVDHVCRERTSLDLAQQIAGNRDFVDATLGGLLRGAATLHRDPERLLVFSPFGLGVLDLAVAEHVRRVAAERGLGVSVADFLPAADA
ncbi:2,3-diaminopropionate biosynthesis protein SbnB [Streptomyces xanthophaeus]|uniref:2,3-diaminopropionate biosynthesis protein SbnB n=1 Tax=Streptomyces xanthophaeus TaxID=67385 RepID=UPI002649B9EC|nr:2,3-diaminopropionate biosynthesis protein SbnB [Streptomyces xanthophaeus]WKD32123.1 2,3-diaminopropionate biosynthesis protein SbnB [Streptomyces xanthophaeus]